MAKQKLNVKFLAIFLGISAVVLVAISGFVLVKWRADPARFIVKGDALMAEGKYDAAAKQYFRANGKDPYPTADYRPYEKAIAAINSTSPATDVEAKSRFRQLIALQLQIEAKPYPHSIDRATNRQLVGNASANSHRYVEREQSS